MSSNRIDIFTDRDGDTLSVVTRDRRPGGNPEPDPVLTITHNGNSQSVVMDDEEVFKVMKELGDAFGIVVYRRGLHLSGKSSQ